MYALSPPPMQHLRHQCKILIMKTEVKKLGTFGHRWEDIYCGSTALLGPKPRHC
jgi:hypothetical protein